MTANGLLISAPRSGSGKTTVTLGILAALRRRGVLMRAAKAGPDYIDPAFHAAATGFGSVNLDSWAMPPPLLDTLLADCAEDADMVVVEGAMGLFDGVPGAASRTGAAADLAARFHLPVLLVLDVSGQSQSAAAVVRGFASHDPSIRIAGVILNQIGSERHRLLIADAIAKYKPNGARLCTRVKTDVLIPANTSNWGAYAVEAALAALVGKPEIMHSAEIERRMIEACVDTHAADGSTGRHILQVDGMPADVSCAVVTMLGCIVRNGLVTGFKRAF